MNIARILTDADSTRNLLNRIGVTAFAVGLCNMDDEMADFSLADLADLDVSDVQEIRFESIPAGVYGFKCVAAELTEGTNRDNEQRFIAEMKFEIVEVKAVVKKLPVGESVDKFLGKVQTEKFYIVPEKAPEGIGRIRAALTDMGLNSAGKLGEVVAAAVDHTFYAKITEQKDKDDPSRVYSRLVLDKKLNK